MSYNFLYQETLASVLVYEKDVDSFFSPTTRGHCGYAADGFWYEAGFQDVYDIAPWYQEPASATRGARPDFPQPAVILLSAASLTIVDTSAGGLDLWMLFYMGDTLAFTQNSDASEASYTPSSLAWANGVLSVVYTPDAGSADTNARLLTLDFAQNQIYIDSSATFKVPTDSGKGGRGGKGGLL